MAKLSELLQAIEVEQTLYERDMDIYGVSYHSQKVAKGHLFVCIKGYKTDGHKYLSQAVANGATAAVVEDFQEGIAIPQFRVANSRIALAQLGATYYHHPAKEMKMIGITGTNGKTTSSFMTNTILEHHGYKTGLIGTVAIKIGDESIPAELTTPESLDLQYYLRQMAERHVSHVTMEVSSAALELYRVQGVDYDIVTLNNVGREHIDHHGSFEQYFESKSSLIRNAGEHSVAILNLDCPYSSSLIDETKAQVLTYGVENATGHLHCKNLDLSTGRAKFTVEITKPFIINGTEYHPSEFEVELKVPGLHSVYNSMVAIAIALISGVSVPTIQEGIRSFPGVERRFEYIFEDEYKIIDDHFANAVNIDVTLGTLKYMDYHQLHLVYAIRGMRGPTVNRENAEAIAYWANKLGFTEIIATKSSSHVTEKDVVTAEEERVFLEVMERANITVHLYDELPDATAAALSKAGSDDLIMLAGCQGMDFGADVALRQLSTLKPEYSKDKLFAPLRHRVIGVTNRDELEIQSSTMR